MAGRINYQEMRIAREAIPLIKIRIKKIRNGLARKKEKKTDRKTNRVLIVSTCIIGDFLSYIPAIREFLKKMRKKADIIVTSPVRPLAEKINGIDKVWIAKSSYMRTIERGKKSRDKIPEGYDSLIVLRIGPESYDMIKGIRFSEIITCDWAYLRYFVNQSKGAVLKKQVRQSREVAFDVIKMRKSLKEIDKNIDLDDYFVFNKKDRDFIKKRNEIRTRDKIILIHTGSGWESRLWEDEKWVELIKKINQTGKFRFIFIGGTEQEEQAFKNISKGLGFKTYSLIKKLDLKELFLLMKKGSYFIGADSGPRNLAHLADLRSVSLRGPGTYFMPLDKRDIVIDKLNGLPGNPFFALKKHQVKSISVDEVFNAFKKISRR